MDEQSRPWYFTKEELESSTPSRKAGMSKELEDSLRYSYCTFIRMIGMRLSTLPDVIMRAIVYCERFFMRRSHTTNCRFLIAMACMRIALRRDASGPVNSEQMVAKVKSCAREIFLKVDLDASSINMNKTSFFEIEEVVVATLTETGLIINPCPYELLHYVYTIINEETIDLGKTCMQKMAEAFINDSLSTTLFLQYEPRIIVAGAILTASRILKIQVLPSDWYLRFGVYSSVPIIDFGMQFGNYYIKSGIGMKSEEGGLGNAQPFAETRHDQPSQDMELEEGELEAGQGAETSADPNAGWVFYTNCNPTRNPPYYPRQPPDIHGDTPGRTDDDRFRRPPRPDNR